METTSTNEKYALESLLQSPLMGGSYDRLFSIEKKFRPVFVAGAQFHYLSLYSSEFQGPFFFETILFRAEVCQTVFRHGFFRQVHFKEIAFRASRFEHCVFDRCTFEGEIPWTEGAVVFENCAFLSSTVVETLSPTPECFVECFVDGGNYPRALESRNGHLVIPSKELTEKNPDLPLENGKKGMPKPQPVNPAPPAISGRFEMLE